MTTPLTEALEVLRELDTTFSRTHQLAMRAAVLITGEVIAQSEEQDRWEELRSRIESMIGAYDSPDPHANDYVDGALRDVLGMMAHIDAARP